MLNQNVTETNLNKYPTIQKNLPISGQSSTNNLDSDHIKQTNSLSSFWMEKNLIIQSNVVPGLPHRPKQTQRAC